MIKERNVFVTKSNLYTTYFEYKRKSIVIKT